MKKALSQLVTNEYLMSFLLHVLLMLLFSLIIIHLPVLPADLTVDWEIEQNSELAPLPAVQDLAQATLKTPEAQTLPLHSPDKVKPEINPAPQTISPEVNAPALQTVNKPVKKIELPELSGTQPANDLPTSGPISKYLSGLKTRLSGKPSSGNNYVFDDVDGQATVLYKVLPNPKITDYGKVTLQFQLKADGSVAAETIIPLQIDGTEYTAESINALKQWRFSVPNFRKDKKYKISFIFNPI